MNKHLLLFLILLAFHSAYAKKVKFAVDMTGQTVNTTGVHVAGDFQEEAGYEGGDWQSNTTEMTNEPGTDIYSVFVDIPAFTKYEYKFINGDQWYEVEFVPLESRVGYDFNDNRWVYVDSTLNDTTMIRPVLFSGNAPAGHYLLRLLVDLQEEESVSPAGVHVAGDFQGWDPAISTLYSFVDKVFEIIVYVEITESYAEYRFANGNTTADYETVPAGCVVDGNRFIELTADTVLEAVCFSSCANCEELGTGEVSLPSCARLYPNPCLEKTNLEFNDSRSSHDVIITDILGKPERYYTGCRKKSLVIPRDNLKTGVYFVRIESENYRLSTLRLVIAN